MTTPTMQRRTFLLTTGAALLTAPSFAATPPADVVTLLHTNDTHSHLEPFARGRYAGQGGIARRATLIKEVRRTQPAALVLDAGDTFQGTPYFNLFKGNAEFETMSAAGYDAVTLGNHDFDGGVDPLVAAMRHAKFQFLSANYQVDHPELAKRMRPWMVKTVGGRRIGLFGLGVAFAGLVSGRLHAGVRYQDPIKAARAAVRALRQDLGAEAVVLLSHLGYTGFRREPGDLDIAAAVPGIDVVIGGHTHTYLKRPTFVKNAGGQTAVTQVGHGGLFLGRIELKFGAQGVAVRGGAMPVV